MKSNRLILITLLGATLSFPACGDWIYDKEDDAGTVITEGSFSQVNASEYTTWAYINLEDGEATVVEQYPEGSTQAPPEKWHFALHRWDCKTNGGAVLETPYSTIGELQAAGSLPAGDFVSDVMTDDKIAIDMSGMMEGNIVYAQSPYNAEMSKWMNVDMSSMPPAYTDSKKVYLLRLADGTMAAIRFTGFIGPSDVKGYLSFDYAYPIEL